MMDDVKRYGNNSQALHFLKTTHKKFGIPNPYEKLRRASFVGLVYTNIGGITNTFGHHQTSWSDPLRVLTLSDALTKN
jgi:hypothetical protein